VSVGFKHNKELFRNFELSQEARLKHDYRYQKWDTQQSGSVPIPSAVMKKWLR